MSNIFNYVKRIRIKKTNFNLSHQEKFSCNMGDLIPLNVIPVLPGDKFSMSVDNLVRFMPMLAPVMHKVKVTFHQFYVPNRLAWEKWNDFITGKDETLVHPYITLTKDNCFKGSLLEFIYGITIPSTSSNTVKVDAMPLRAYNLIWNLNYRDEDLQDEVAVSLASGQDTTTNQTMLKRAWMKDYFTSARKSAQHGDPVEISIGETAPVSIYGNGKSISLIDGNGKVGLVGKSNNTTDGQLVLGRKGSPTQEGVELPSTNEYPSYDSHLGAQSLFGFSKNPENSGLVGEADLTEATPISIPALRNAFTLQRMRELENVVGSRIKEFLMGFFGVKSSDARLDLPEFLGGYSSDLVFSEVLQTSSGTSTSPQGNMSGHGFNFSKNKLCRNKFFEEHGYLLTLFSITPKTGYSQGISRNFTKTESRYDYPLPLFQHIGEQEIKNKEIYADCTEEEQEEVFGYQSRYSEYKYMPDRSYAEMNDTLNYWNFNRLFSSVPALNEDFIKCVPTKRPFAVESENEDCVVVQANFNIIARRPFTKFSSPR